MKSLLVFASILGLALSQHWGQPAPVQETPEVAAARSAHLAALARANGQPAAPSWNQPAPSWQQPAAPSWNQAQPGLPQDTPEVAAAKAAHLAALARVNSQPQQQNWNAPQQSWNAPQQQSWNAPQQTQPRWTGPIALPPGLDANGAPLPVQDTPEVAAERARHFSLYSGGGHPSLLPAQNQWNSAPAQQWNAPAPQWNAPAQNQWNAPAPNQWNQWNSNPAAQAGLPADTPEVAAAKAAHFAAHARLGPQQSHQGRWKRSAVLAASPLLLSAPAVISHAPILRTAHVVAPVTTISATSLAIAHPAPIHFSHW